MSVIPQTPRAYEGGVRPPEPAGDFPRSLSYARPPLILDPPLIHAYAQTLIVIVLINPYVNIPVWLNSQHIVL